MSLISKIKYHSLLKNYFRRVSKYLENGFYIVKNNEIIPTKRTLKNNHCVFKVKSAIKSKTLYASGRMFVTTYKYGLLTDDKAFYFIHNKQRYYLYKSNYENYRNKLHYPAFNVEFLDDEKVIVAPIVKGTIYKDLSHFDIFLGKLFEYASQAEITSKTSLILGNKYVLPWYVQHGDCKNTNIVWKSDNSFEMIDLEAIDLYPPLYDVFYYLFISQKENSIPILKSKAFQDKVKLFFERKHEKYPNNIADTALANYANYTVSKLVRGADLYEFEFYLYWRKYDSFVDFPLTKGVLNNYEKKLKEYHIK